MFVPETTEAIKTADTVIVTSKLLFNEAAREDFPELAVERIPQVIYMRSEIARVHDYGFRSMRPTTKEEVDKAIFAAPGRLY